MGTAAFVPYPGLVVVLGLNINHWGAFPAVFAVARLCLLPCQRWVIPSRHLPQVAREASDLVDPCGVVVDEKRD
jgi:hypothetical protein